ncbi:hypothetical protein LCGC14_1867330 [marine sediment metagenome]|uniref:Uncharacterized protein n=1 Tax=marine sediment metagenome TaxID=412755 RepID=A0A0F9GU11_9ZZZZ
MDYEIERIRIRVLFNLYYMYLSYPKMKWNVGIIKDNKYYIYRTNPNGVPDYVPYILTPVV